VSEALYTVALLACPVGMGTMMWFMMRGGAQRGSGGRPGAHDAARDAELVQLRAEVDQLRAAQRDTETGPEPDRRPSKSL
jgi:hypothetical protein